MSIPIRIHPDNPKIFEFRGKPIVLLTATEHYGAVINRPLDFERYLADAGDKKMTLTRLFTLFREQQASTNPYSTCKPESPDYIAPFARVGGGTALDGQPKYDLEVWNPEFFDRLHRFVRLASDYGIIVEVTLLSNTYADSVWALNQLHSANNVNGLEDTRWHDYNTMRNPRLFDAQIRHVRKIVEETRQYDNVIYEICNEPGGFNSPGDTNQPSCAEVDQWQMAVADAIRKADSGLPRKHLIAGQQAFAYDPFTQSVEAKSFADFGIDIVNVHPLPNTVYASERYDMGEFMSKQLKLRAVRDFCLATYHEPKPLNYDEDNAASQYKDFDGWTIHRKRAWTALLSGAHYDYIDFSIINYCPAGTPESRRCIRSWMKHLSEFVHSIDLARARPLPTVVGSVPAHVCVSALAVDGEDYCIYLADERELADQHHGLPIKADLILDIPDGRYNACCYSPVSGLYSPSVALEAAGGAAIALPEFAHDLAVRIRRCP